MLNDEDSFPPLTMLPMLSHAIAGALDASKEQLTNLLQAEKKPYVLDDDTVNRVIKSYTEQNKTIVNEKALCAHWRQKNLTAEQVKILDEISANLTEMEKINQRILSLAVHYKEHTIDKILEMEDGELALAYLTGKLYPPTDGSNTSSGTSNQRKSFALPPSVTCHHKKIANKGDSYTFRHAEWGEIGRIDVIPHGSQSQITAYAVVGDPRDPMTELRHAMFRVISIEFNNELEKKYGAGISAIPPHSDSGSNKKLIESKAMVCLTCNTPVALLIFAHDAYTPDQLEDYARMMYLQTVEMNLPTWIIGAEEELVPGKEGMALILQTWPERRKAEKLSSLIFEPMLHKLQNGHCR